jgi:hypothetical protein
VLCPDSPHQPHPQVRAEELRQRRDARLVTVRGLRERALGMLRQLGAEPGDACLSHDEHDLTQTRVRGPLRRGVGWVRAAPP